ncbi:MAG: hypothetical protein DRP62_00050 [Planctomycetota bacterium]|nr:MAG: hypothetical protein DRP62_00050 [Planctomycetota bacterium]
MATETYTGENASITIKGLSHAALGISDFSLTLSRDTIEEPLVGEKGNFYMQGPISVEGSLTAAKLSHSAAGALLEALINGNTVEISGCVGDKSLHFYFKSAQITGFDISIGDASTITEGSIDFSLLMPYKVSSVTYLPGGGTYIKDF